MDIKSNDLVRYRRKIRGEEDEKWECSVCTYINPSESYKCQICFMRKGTSTRKPRVNPQVLEQQQLIAQAILKEKDEDHRKKKSDRCPDRHGTVGTSFKMRNVDRSSPLLFEIFANGYSVVITEYQFKSKTKPPVFSESPPASNCSSLQGFLGTPSIVQEQLSPSDSVPTPDTASRIPSLSDYDLGDSAESKMRSHCKSGKSVVSTRTSELSMQSSRILPKLRSTNPNCSASPRSIFGSYKLDIKHKQLPTESEQAGGDRGGEDDNVDSRKSRVSNYSARRKASSRRVHSVYQSKNVLKRLRIERSQNSPLVLRSERLSSSEHLNLPSHNSRHHSDIGRSSAVSSKRRKPSGRITEPKANSSLHKRFNFSTCPDSASSDHSWPSFSASKTVKERPLRITVKKLKPSFIKRPRKTASSTARNVKRSQRTFSSTSPSELKCKIRMIRSPNHTSQFTSTLENGCAPTADSISLSIGNVFTLFGATGCTDDPSVDPSAIDSRESAANIPSRLSTESRNTSAMTDSSGATALEISG